MKGRELANSIPEKLIEILAGRQSVVATNADAFLLPDGASGNVTDDQDDGNHDGDDDSDDNDDENDYNDDHNDDNFTHYF